jgi:hypothetical protein
MHGLDAIPVMHGLDAIPVMHGLDAIPIVPILSLGAWRVKKTVTRGGCRGEYWFTHQGPFFPATLGIQWP